MRLSSVVLLCLSLSARLAYLDINLARFSNRSTVSGFNGITHSVRQGHFAHFVREVRPLCHPAPGWRFVGQWGPLTGRRANVYGVWA
jgi:hypothetical protein